ncbi:MAG: 50S ribosomal protein L10 [Thermoanaerobaculia bacterium]
MALTREKKQSILDQYGEGLSSASHAFVIGFKGITVNQVTELRRRIRNKGGKYVVVKNTLARRAVEGKSLAGVADHFSGPTAIAWSPTDPVALAKVLTEFAKEAPALEFKAGLVEGRAVGGQQIGEIAAMPGRQELLAKLVFLLQSPIARFVRVLAAAGPQRLATVIDQVRQKKESQV